MKIKKKIKNLRTKMARKITSENAEFRGMTKDEIKEMKEQVKEDEEE
jgi:protein-arginine kinase activator protein McsA